MSSDKRLTPTDFPVKPVDNVIITRKKAPVAVTVTQPTAKDIAERLNEQAAREEEDRWSA